jgi:shikimate dehydrogenase
MRRAVAEAARRLGARVVTDAGGIGRAACNADADLIIHAAYPGMFPIFGRSRVSLGLFPRCQGVVETGMHPLRSALALSAREQGLPVTQPLWMLAQRARLSAQLFLGASIPETRLTPAVQTLSQQMHNVVLLGMPGCGKTAVGRVLARTTGRGFLDADMVMEQRSGLAIRRLLAREGEAAFRDMEAKTLSRLGRQMGKIIVAGAGAVLAECNYGHLKQNGIIIFLDRPLERLSPKSRALAGQQGKLEQLRVQRMGRYLHFCDAQIENDGPLDAVADRVWHAFQAIAGEI